ncbi:GAF domain-containing protein [Saccharopolyspora rhizosphaerae]|uniref:GAF domain-containing protein n=1 Tax=Saccharopolyspora rhizosphaerae TaxID=2492662 RepID=A0A426JLT8_9PSEU|nr:GAF domain-containing SpoIIE family protein phosphatase [Saccharopolyspora rhizosphaerae]RRO14179.1 GAF domain-containing protein [Saccharopolyspora rhizosphaerae]
MHASAELSAEERLRRIERVTDTSLANLDVNGLLRDILARVREVLGVDMATVMLLDPAGEELIATAAVGLDDAVKQGVRMPVGHGFAGTVLADRQASVFDQVTDDLLVSRALRERGISSLAGAPMVTSSGVTIGVLCVGAFTEHAFTDHDARLVQVAADRIASVSQVSSSRAERIAATVLQHSLLPGKLPEIPSATMDGRYVGGADHGIGGDWYDVFALPGDRTGIVVGDVVGHGLSAAVVMGRLRSALRAYALDDDNPAHVLHKLDRKVTHFESDAMATVSYAIYEPATARMVFSLAGHLPPVVAKSGGCGELVDAPVDPPVGVEVSKKPRRTTEIEVAPDSVVCFYTDGLVERGKQPIDIGLKNLCGAVTCAPAGAVCATVMNELVTESSNDDVTLLVLSRATAAV